MSDNINNEKSFVEIEDELNAALEKIGENKEKTQINEDRVAAITVQELLEQLKIDEFEKIYITTATQSNYPTNEEISENQMQKVQTLAEYQLSKMDKDEQVSLDEQEKLKTTSNFYLIPHVSNYKYSVGNNEETKTKEFYTINDVEGYSLYTVIDNDITISSGFKLKIKDYLEEYYIAEVESGMISTDDIIEHFTPEDMSELYNMLGNDAILSIRFLPDRIDEYLETKGIAYKDFSNDLIEKDEADEVGNSELQKERKQSNEESIAPKEKPGPKLQEDEGETLEEPDNRTDKVRDGASIRLKEDVEEKEIKVESYIEKIARVNHVNPAVVNTRIIENFEKVEEDTGIHLKGRYPRGEVVAVRIPYKLAYRTFLVEKSTGMTIDGKGRMDTKPGKLYDFDEIEDYFRFKLRYGHDGGEDGKPLRKDEGRDYTTYLDEYGEIKKEKFINNGKKQDMLNEERDRYLLEVEDADKRLKEAIDEYQKHATKENYQKVRDVIQEKVKIDNKYNALDEQREITEKTTKNAKEIIKEYSNKEGGRSMFDDFEDSHFGGRYR